MARTARKKVAILDEGMILTDDVDSIDFTGAGISGSVFDKDVTENVVGGSGATNVFGEDIPGSGTSFTLAHTPLSGTLCLFRGGARQQLGNDYTLSGDTITLSVAKIAEEILLADYQY